jgi:aldehyde dehydrogenase (NAD+)
MGASGSSLAAASESLARAIAVGNTVVLAPRPGATLCALPEVCHTAGLPPGVLNVVAGNLTVSVALASQQAIGGVSFAGTPAAGTELRRSLAGRDLLVALNLGSRSVVVVFDDADLDSAAAGTIDEMRRFHDPARRGGTRLMMQEGIAEAFCSQLRWRMDRLRVRDPLNPSTDVGPVQSAEQISQLRQLLDVARVDGASAYQAGGDIPEDGWYFGPTLLYDVPAAAQAAQLDVSGPVLVATTFRSPGEAIALANSVGDGMRLSVWTEDITTALAAARDLAAGSVSLNGGDPADPAFATSPVRESGYGDVGGRDGFFAFVRLRAAGHCGHAREPEPADHGSPETPAAGGVEPGATAVESVEPGAPAVESAEAGAPAVERAEPGATAVESAEPGAPAVESVALATDRANQADAWSAMTNVGRSRVLLAAAALIEERGAAALLRTYGAWAAHVGDELNPSVDGGLLVTTREAIGIIGLIAAETREAGAGSATAGAAQASDGSASASGSAARDPDGPASASGGAARDSDGPASASGSSVQVGDDPGRIPEVLEVPEHPSQPSFTELVVSALAAGNRVVVACTQRERTAHSELERVLSDAGAPVGTLSVASGSPRDLALALAEHDGVDMIWFAGPENTAAEIQRLSCSNAKRLSQFELADPSCEQPYRSYATPQSPSDRQNRPCSTEVPQDEKSGRQPDLRAPVNHDLLRLATHQKSVWVALEPSE